MAPAEATSPEADGPPPLRPLRVVLGVLRPQRSRLVLLTALTVVGGFAEAFLLVVVAQIAITVTEAGTVDQIGIGPLSWELPRTLEGLYLVTGGLLALRLVAQISAGRLAARTITDTQRRLRKDLVTAFVRADWDTQAKEADGHIQDLVTTHVSRAGSSVSVLSGSISGLVNFLAMIGSALIVAPGTAALVLVAIGSLFVAFRPLSRFGRHLAERRSRAGQDLARRVTETVSNALEIRTANVTDAALADVHHSADEMAELERRAAFLQSILPPLYQGLGLVALLAALAAMYTWSTPAAGALGAVLLLLLRAVSYSQVLQVNWHQVNEMAPYVREVQNELDRYEAAAVVRGDRPLGPIQDLRLSDVGYSYLPGQPTLTGVDLEISRGQMLGVIGPSGAGKSTLIQLLLGLRDPDDGAYLVNGAPVTDYEADSWFGRVAFVPQEPRLVSGTVAENIAFWRDVPDAAVQEASVRAHLHPDIAAMPDAYDTDVGPRGSRLSGGQKQRVAIARALVGAPDLLVLDEPTSALDLRSEGLIEETFRSLHGEVTMVVIAHRLSTISACDRLLVLEHGAVQAFGTPDEVERVSPFFREALARTRAGFLLDELPPKDLDPAGA